MAFWRFENKAATKGEPEKVELWIEGEIVSDDDAWIYEWMGIECTSRNAFKDELKQYEGKDITVWINSYGGNVFAATGIYNALMEHEGNVTVKIDGMAMSAASTIAMAGGEILMTPGAIMMIHNPLTATYGYASDLRKTADILDEVKEAIMNAYELKTGRARNDISALMDEESYMSARTAIKEGFADDMLYEKGSDEGQEVTNVAFNRLAIVNSATAAAKRFYDIKQKLKPDNPDNPPPDDTKQAKARLQLQIQLLSL